MTKPFHSPLSQALQPENEQPELTFFDDPAIDRLMGVVMNLATEVFVLRERCAAQEAQLVDQGLIDHTGLSEQATASEVQIRASQQEAFVAHLLEPLRGIQVTRPAS